MNISLIVNDSEAEQCVKALHHSFFESGDLSELTVDGENREIGNGSAMKLNNVWRPFATFFFQRGDLSELILEGEFRNGSALPLWVENWL